MNKEEEFSRSYLAFESWIKDNYSDIGQAWKPSEFMCFKAGYDAALSTEVKEAIRKVVEVNRAYANDKFYNGYVFVQPVQIADDDFDWCPDEGGLAKSCSKEIELLEELLKDGK